MKYNRNIKEFIIFRDESLLSALNQIEANRKGIIFATDSGGVIEGVMTDGDFRRWMMKQTLIDLNQPVINTCNKDFAALPSTTDPLHVKELLSKKIKYLPIVDKNGRVQAIASEDSEGIIIDGYLINSTTPTFIISEIGINHNGSLDLAKRMVEESIKAGANCAKFQMRDLKSLYVNAGDINDSSQDLGSQYTLDLLSRFQLKTEEMFSVFDYCKSLGIIPLCTPWDISSVDKLEEYGMPAYKVASADLTNHELLHRLIETTKPLLVSTGMSRENEIIETSALLQSHGVNYALLHCNSTYPAPFKDINLNYIERLKEIGNCPVGYSGHERGIHIAIASVAKGAKIIEKHFTLDRGSEGNDHKVSLLPAEFKAMVSGVRQVEEALGTSNIRDLTQGERMNRETLAKSLVATRPIEIDEIIEKEMVAVKSPGNGLQPNKLKELLGQKASRKIMAGGYFYPTDLVSATVQSRNYQCKRPWGVPVRFHDYRNLLSRSNPDFLELHLSYKDMEVNLKDFFVEPLNLDLVVHSPDLFRGDHILNLAATDKQYRQRSIDELQRVIEFTRRVKPYFTKTKRTFLVTSLGGATKDGFVSESKRDAMFETIGHSLSQLDTEGVEILGQTLPPFPWYMGGQLYLNVFIEHKKTAAFCKEFNMRLCFDVSHSKLSCNHIGISFEEYVKVIAPYVAHLHLVDAAGVDGEGLQIGEGEIDFAALAKSLDEYCPRASFIPEIWQGHKNEGQGFWLAMERLEAWF